MRCINVKGKTAIYARVALYQNNNLEKQVKKIKKEVEMDDCEVYAEVASGLETTRQSRKDWFRLLDDIENGKITLIYLTGYDRIGRDDMFVVKMLNKLNKLGCEIHQTF